MKRRVKIWLLQLREVLCQILNLINCKFKARRQKKSALCHDHTHRLGCRLTDVERLEINETRNAVKSEPSGMQCKMFPVIYAEMQIQTFLHVHLQVQSGDLFAMQKKVRKGS